MSKHKCHHLIREIETTFKKKESKPTRIVGYIKLWEIIFKKRPKAVTAAAPSNTVASTTETEKEISNMIKSPKSTNTDVYSVPVPQSHPILSVLSPEQQDALEQEFLKVKTLHSSDLEILAAELGLSENVVQTWYTERLAAWRREQGLSDSFGSF